MNRRQLLAAALSAARMAAALTLASKAFAATSSEMEK